MTRDRLADPFLEHEAIVGGGVLSRNACRGEGAWLCCDMRLALLPLVLGLLVGLSVGACADYPRHEFLDLPVGSTLGEVGRSSLQLVWNGQEASFRVSRCVAARLDVTARMSGEDLFSLGARILVLEEPGLLSLTCEVEGGTLRMIAGLPLGPFRLDWGRAFAGEERRWVAGTATLSPYWAGILGIEYGGEAGGRPLLGVRLFPGFGLSALFCWRGGDLVLSLGGER